MMPNGYLIQFCICIGMKGNVHICSSKSCNYSYPQHEQMDIDDRKIGHMRQWNSLSGLDKSPEHSWSLIKDLIFGSPHSNVITSTF